MTAQPNSASQHETSLFSDVVGPIVDIPRAKCCICRAFQDFHDEQDGEDRLLRCECCDLQVHSWCYGADDSSGFRCSPCKQTADTPDSIRCALCLTNGGAFKPVQPSSGVVLRVNCNRLVHQKWATWLKAPVQPPIWVHYNCAILIPDMGLTGRLQSPLFTTVTLQTTALKQS